MMILDQILKSVENKSQVLIFSQFTTVLDILEDYLAYKEYEFCRIDGSTFMEEREK
jgi:SWI/SNF-related matrix-associated actin-dependent regulator of chromatin subfamily A member 5